MKLRILNSCIISSFCIAFAGCAPSNMTELAQALAKDPATLDLTLTTPWGTQTLHRSVPINTNSVPTSIVTPVGTNTQILTVPVVTSTSIPAYYTSVTNVTPVTVTK